MRRTCYRVIGRHLYLIWGTVVVAVVTVFTGAFISSIIGYTASIGVIALAAKVLK